LSFFLFFNIIFIWYVSVLATYLLGTCAYLCNICGLVRECMKSKLYFHYLKNSSCMYIYNLCRSGLGKHRGSVVARWNNGRGKDSNSNSNSLSKLIWLAEIWKNLQKVPSNRLAIFLAIHLAISIAPPAKDNERRLLAM
jgi:hypothetical protein